MASPYNPFPVNPFKQGLKERKKQIGCWCTLANPISAEILGLAGFDWLQLDCEHSLNDPLTIVTQLMALKDSVSAPVVRPPWNDMILLKRFLDAGVYNFLIPYVESAEQAYAAVAATRYPPQGIRGFGAQQRQNRYGTVANFLETINDNIAIMVQIESVKGVAASEEIAAVPGVDALFCGPWDLAMNMGYPNNPYVPEVQETIRCIGETALATGKAAAIMAPGPDDVPRYSQWGYSCFAVGNDAGILRKHSQALRDAHK
jgi:2-dehydro-3-deoxyglucarate aldolase